MGGEAGPSRPLGSPYVEPVSGTISDRIRRGEIPADWRPSQDRQTPEDMIDPKDAPPFIGFGLGAEYPEPDDYLPSDPEETYRPPVGETREIRLPSCRTCHNGVIHVEGRWKHMDPQRDDDHPVFAVDWTIVRRPD